MNKHQFISSLQQSLAALEPSAVTDILADFEEHFSAGMARGKSEEAVAAELGDPVIIARQYIEAAADGRTIAQPVTAWQQNGRTRPEGYEQQQAQATAGKSNIDLTGLTGVILLNLFIGIPLWLTLFAILAGFWAGAGSIGAAAVVLFVLAVFRAGVVSLVLLLFGIALTALTILCIIFLIYLSRWLIFGLGAWIRWNRRLILGGEPA